MNERKVMLGLQIGDGRDCGCDDLPHDVVLEAFNRPAGDCAHCLHFRYPLGSGGAFNSFSCGRCGRLWEATEIT